ncbi:ArsR/SmtB family transcription factor [Anaerolinea thermophila]|uniref:ArsR family transcriptional regulator n=1 Tax=Anaerolinea thermophila (strain DSM 14523 / JCM 11388 / NBRC 100420 / UNI-1) TaxID=926569 RepID=E8N417_ANATU|nr:ArsR family transcriptional regulator [Anaerolinea thermophila]BAJ63181.1 ArsR family transcriptional regulator [Anaerolinea thermophila UNI-1]
MTDSSMTNYEKIPNARLLELLAEDHELQKLEAVTKALGSETRLKILKFLSVHTSTVMEIAEALGLPPSTATLHINILENAGLIKTDLRPATRGLQRVCARVYDRIIIQLPAYLETAETPIEVSMPIGAYTQIQAIPTCGLVGELGIIGHLDDPSAFYEPQRIYAQLIWFRRGFLEYHFPYRLPPGSILNEIEISFEVCSEAPLHHPDWPSDITLWIGGIEIGTWTSPADFGGERGMLTPAWWDTQNSQYGLLKVWKVTSTGSYVDGVQVSSIKVKDLPIKPGEPISVRIGIKENATNVGGMNLFGSKFGNYPQDIVMRQYFKRVGKE